MIFTWLKNRRRRKMLEEEFPSAWEEYLENNLRYYSFLDGEKRRVVQSFVRIFSAEKSWYGVGQAITEEMKVTVAGQAAEMILGLEEPYYFDRVQTIILHPAAFKHKPRQERWIFGGLKYLGQAWYHSPIVLSWNDVLRCGRDESNGMNVVLHEFAHHLDGFVGDVNGSPPLVGQPMRDWQRVAESEYRRLVGKVRRKEAALLDYYGATNLAEFFAVATECFFERPSAMRREHEELYSLLRDFYRQDPAEWLPDAKVGKKTSSAEPEDEGREANPEADRPERQTDNPDDLFTLAVVYLNEGKFALAERTASQALELDAHDAESYELRARIRIKSGYFSDALRDCDFALKIDPEEFDAYLTRAAAYIGLEKYQLAKEDIGRVSKHFRNNAEFFYLDGLIAAAEGQYRQAISDFSNSLWLRPFSADAYYRRSLAYQKLEQRNEAESDRQKAFELDPQVDRPTWLRTNRK